jgi:mono/diheme cytochrome c family protein
VSGTPDLTTALVLVGLFLAILLSLLSYHRRGSGYITWGVGLMVLGTVIALIDRAFSQPSFGVALAVGLLLLGVMLSVMTYQSRTAAFFVFFIGVALFLLGLPFLGAGRGDLALLSFIGGPALLMLLANVRPDVPARFSRIGVVNAPVLPTRAELAIERRRYTRLAAGVTVASLAGVWLLGGVPTGPVTAAPIQITWDQAKADKGAQLYQEYGCVSCHSINGTAGAGPTWKGLYGHQVRLDNGQVVTADEAYVRESILQPDAKIVNGFGKGVMLGAIGPKLPDISQPQNLDALVEFIKEQGK